MKMARERILLSDVDNTLFSWVDFFAPCFRALVHAVSRESKIPEQTLYEEFQITFKQEGSVEYKRAIQDNLAIQTLSPDEQERMVDLGAKVFSIAMRKHLKPYEGVKDTLEGLRRDGVRIVAVTNSGALQAVDRVRRLGLARYLDGLVAWDHDVAQIADTQKDYQEALRARTNRSGLGWTITLSREQLKPSPAAYQLALDRIGVPERDVWVIGDSLEKDLLSTSGIGASSVWAKYGHGFNQENFDTLLRITHWSAAKIERTYDTSTLQPDFVVSTFSEITDLIGLRQGRLF